MGEAFQHWNGRHSATRFEPGDGGLLDPGPLGELRLSDAKLRAATPHRFSQFEVSDFQAAGASASECLRPVAHPDDAVQVHSDQLPSLRK